MKTLRILGMILIAGFLFSCEKDVKDEVKMGEVSFGVNEIDPTMLKSDTWDWECSEDVPVSALIQIDDVWYNPLVFYLGDPAKLYTQAIKLGVGSYNVQQFYILGEVVDELEDFQLENLMILKAAPIEDSEFSAYVDDPLEITIIVEAFEKDEFQIEVLCYQPGMHEQFGFFWFNITEIVVREICFFGDVCIEEGEDYSNSGYADIFDLNDYPFDLPAIFMIEAFRDGAEEPYDTFSNVVYNEDEEKWEKAGDFMTVCARYSDYLNSEVNYEFVLKVMNYDSDFIEVYTWNFTNEEPLVEIKDEDQKVVNFVIGGCTYGDYEDPDVELDWPAED